MGKIFRQFAADMKEQLEKTCGDGYRITVHEIKKNNGIPMIGISILQEGEEGVPVPLIYLEDFFGWYNAGDEMEELADAIYALYRQHRSAPFAIGDLSTFDKVQGRICQMLVNAAMNRERLQTLPHRLFMDLAIIYYIPVDTAEGTASLTVTDGMMRSWGADEQMLYLASISNTSRLQDYRVTPIEEVISQLWESGNVAPAPEMDHAPEIYIASSRCGAYGASCLLDDAWLADFAERTGGDYYILPANIHDLIFVPAQDGGADGAAMGEIVRSINAEQLDREEVLADHAYFYRALTGKLEIVG